MRYQPLEPVSKDEAESRFASGDAQLTAETLISIALNYPDNAWVEKYISRFAAHQHPDVRRAAALSLGHLARIHGYVGDSALTAVQALIDDEDMSGAVDDALEDVKMFTQRK